MRISPRARKWQRVQAASPASFPTTISALIEQGAPALLPRRRGRPDRFSRAVDSPLFFPLDVYNADEPTDTVAAPTDILTAAPTVMEAVVTEAVVVMVAVAVVEAAIECPT